MANLFKTMTPPPPTQTTPNLVIQKPLQENSDPNISPVNYQDFRTVANLFKTNAGISIPKKEEESTPALNEIKNINQINMGDFNTMQNLFKTMGSQMPTEWQTNGN